MCMIFKDRDTVALHHLSKCMREITVHHHDQTPFSFTVACEKDHSVRTPHPYVQTSESSLASAHEARRLVDFPLTLAEQLKVTPRVRPRRLAPLLPPLFPLREQEEARGEHGAAVEAEAEVDVARAALDGITPQHTAGDHLSHHTPGER